ncbi:MAG: DUF2867 domain-containing protein [Chitinophaga sp.]|uniref:DUF2867 domain-containing protein n=1 Tax=Chitinophaga sp. TaxID=1869181 RepID=UPI001B24EFAA|nr:DUF2867 domain-containing protein [Chitinophaga sp.]MBO9729530.1 DUF2867 domain-containing protein [Chitinophaga sp.]
MSAHTTVPTKNCYRDIRTATIADPEQTLYKIFSIGGTTGWYYANWLWQLRGFIDEIFGGPGLRRGRSHPNNIHTGEALDVWRVAYANREERRLLLYAEMKLPGEAWLEFYIDENNVLHQTATYVAHGLAGHLYWYAVLPFHGFIFKEMIKALAKAQ